MTSFNLETLKLATNTLISQSVVLLILVTHLCWKIKSGDLCIGKNMKFFVYLMHSVIYFTNIMHQQCSRCWGIAMNKNEDSTFMVLVFQYINPKTFLGRINNNSKRPNLGIYSGEANKKGC